MGEWSQMEAGKGSEATWVPPLEAPAWTLGGATWRWGEVEWTKEQWESGTGSPGVKREPRTRDS